MNYNLEDHLKKVFDCVRFIQDMQSYEELDPLNSSYHPGSVIVPQCES